MKNVLLVETANTYDAGSIANPFDLAGNGIVNNTTATTASLFAALPTTPDVNTTAAAFDWSLSATSAAATGGMATFTGNLATAAAAPLTSGNGTVAGTAYVGAVAPGATAKWWAGWTVYAQK